MTEHVTANSRLLAQTASHSAEPIMILICQHLTCRKQGAAKVLAAVREHALPGITYQGCGCLGRCGNGPNVLVLPAQIWYHRVRPQDIPTILADCASSHDEQASERNSTNLNSPHSPLL
jgi:(2Fe-2S) ferredoxin